MSDTELSRWDIQIDVQGGVDIRQHVKTALNVLVTGLVTANVVCEVTAFDGDSFDSRATDELVDHSPQ